MPGRPRRVIGQSSTAMAPIEQAGCWRVRIIWTNGQVNRFGRFDSKEAAQRWINEHWWLTEGAANKV